MRALILGGTREARDLAKRLVEAGADVVSSLAGRVKNPALPAGEVRIGGFGGPEGLAAWIKDNNIDILIDATHPFAEKISRSTATATATTGTPLVLLHRPAWEKQPGEKWIEVSSMDEAAAEASAFGTVLLTIGRQKLASFAPYAATHFVIRCVDEPEVALPPDHEIIYSRGPFTEEGEEQLLRESRVQALVTKNSGGGLTHAKLIAAKKLGIPVIIVQRPPLPALEDTSNRPVRVTHTADEAFDALATLRKSGKPSRG